MRNIKFRGIKVDNGEWEYGFYWASLDPCSFETKWRSHYIHNGCNIETPFEIIPETLGEYIGLKDNKRTKEFPEGQEIYEGDIIPSINGRHWLIEHSINDVGFILYDGLNSIRTIEGNFIPPRFSADGRGYYDLEIIGNIHQDKNLLK